MRFFRGLSFLGLIASLAIMVFQDSGLVEKMSSVDGKQGHKGSDSPKISMVETIKTLQKLKNLREEVEDEYLKDCGQNCLIKSSWDTTKRAPSQVHASTENQNAQELNQTDDVVPVVKEPGAPALIVNYQPPEMGPQTLELIGSKDFKMLELSQNSLINFEIPSGLSRCQYKNPKGLISNCLAEKSLAVLRSVEKEDIGMHRFRFMINETVYEYRIQVVGLR